MTKDCSYADLHKSKRWQPYAVATAAVWTKEVASVIPPAEVAKAYAEEAMKGASIQHNDHISNDVTERNSQASSLKHSSKRISTIPSTVSHTHGLSNMIGSSTGKGTEAITDFTDHTKQHPTVGAQRDKQEEHPSSLGPSTARTIYAPSATLTSPAVRDKGFITDLAAKLFGVVNCPGITEDALNRISKLLPGLLRAFAVKVGYQAQTSMHRDVMFYVRRERM
jgi:hypothetical protein